MCVGMFMCVFASEAINILYDWISRSYGFYIAAIVHIISRHGLGIDMHCRNQPNSKLGNHKPLLSL